MGHFEMEAIQTREFLRRKPATFRADRSDPSPRNISLLRMTRNRFRRGIRSLAGARGDVRRSNAGPIPKHGQVWPPSPSFRLFSLAQAQ
jgi:hypothetical protein